MVLYVRHSVSLGVGAPDAPQMARACAPRNAGCSVSRAPRPARTRRAHFYFLGFAQYRGPVFKSGSLSQLPRHCGDGRIERAGSPSASAKGKRKATACSFSHHHIK